VKLLFCKACQDVFKLNEHPRRCRCQLTYGRYIDDVNAIYMGEHAVPIGFANTSFAQAIVNQPRFGDGARFEAFVIPEECATFRRGD
jgi:hypothetical protein